MKEVPFLGYKAPFWGNTVLKEDMLTEANCLLEFSCLIEADCLTEAKPLLGASSIGFRVSGLLFGALRAL